MQSIILKTEKNYPSVIVYKSSNSFGDQILTCICETIDGTREEFTNTESEGCWLSFDKKTMLKLFKSRIDKFFNSILKAGSIIEYKNNKNEIEYATIIELESNTDFYFYSSDKNGNPVGFRKVPEHSNSIFNNESIKGIGFKKLKIKKVDDFEIIKTGIDEIDIKMVQLGNTYKLFDKLATNELKAIFNRNEDRNSHSLNDNIILNFTRWIEKKRKPETFLRFFKYQ